MCFGVKVCHSIISKKNYNIIEALGGYLVYLYDGNVPFQGIVFAYFSLSKV